MFPVRDIGSINGRATELERRNDVSTLFESSCRYCIVAPAASLHANVATCADETEASGIHGDEEP
jgi:hypothetical protein